MEANIDVQKLKTLFEQIISGSECVNRKNDRIEEEDMKELGTCVDLFADFGNYVNSRIGQIVEKTKRLEDAKNETVVVDPNMNVKNNTIPGINFEKDTSTDVKKEKETIPDIKVEKADEKPRSYDITRRKKHRQHKEKDYDRNICEEHAPPVLDQVNKIVSPVSQKKITFDCSICDHISDSSNDIDTHVKTKHTDIKLKCGQCHFTALEKRRIQLHKQKDHQGFTYPCTKCKFIATKNEVLKGHVKLEHEKVVDFECEKCGYLTMEKKDFKKHMKIVHRK